MKRTFLALAALATLTVTTASARTTTVSCNFPRFGAVKLEMHIGPRVRNAETYMDQQRNNRFFMTVAGQRSSAMKTPESFVGGPGGQYVMSPGDDPNEWSFGILGGSREVRATCRRA